MEQSEIKTRRHFSAEQKFKIVKEQLSTKVVISELCKRHDITSSVFYRWQALFFEAALDRFKQGKEGPTRAEQRKIDGLEKDILRMKDVIAEITAENIVLKKTLGE